MRKRLIIVGAGGFGREVLSWAKDVQSQVKKWEIAGFIDDNKQALLQYNYELPIIDTIRDYFPQENDLFVMGIAAPTQTKLEIAEMLLKRGAVFINLIHHTAIMGHNVKLGMGCVICPYVILSCDIEINNFVTLNCYVGIGHDAVIGKGCTLYSYVNINGVAKIGTGVEIGGHACVLPHAVVGDFAKVGAGSVVLKQVKPGTTVIGVPAKKL